jgi:hypothetical protein
MSRKRWRKKKVYTGPLVVAGKTTTGQDFKPSCGQCDVPPWEICECSFQWAKDGLASPPCDAALSPAMPAYAAITAKPEPSTPAERLNAEADERLQLALADL